MNSERWEIDSSHSGIHFAVRHLMISKVRGRFSRWSGHVEVPNRDWNLATVNVVIDASSIDTGIQGRDSHLCDPDYLDVRRYPEICFRSRFLTPKVDGHRQLVGELTLKGRTRQVTVDVEDNGVTDDPWGNERAGFSARTTLDRRDFDVMGNLTFDKSGIVIGDRIDVEIEVESVRQVAAHVV